MGVLKVKHEANYTVISNHPIEDDGLTADALGVLLYLMSKPHDWIVRPTQLQQRFSVGRDKMQGILKTLEDTGYIRRERLRDEETKAFAATQYVVMDVPVLASDGMPQPEKPVVGEPQPEKPSTEKPSPANPQLLITDLLPSTECTKHTSSVDDLDSEFDQWWCDEYPDRDGSHSKAKAKQAYIRYRKKGVSKEQIWQATLTYFQELEAHDRVSTRFVKHATTFLNEEPWVQ